MATRDVSDGTRTVERWTNVGTAGYYAGNPLTKQRNLTATESAELAAIDTALTGATNATTINDYLVARRTRLATIRTEAAAVIARANIATGTLSSAVLSTSVRDLQADLKKLAAAIDDLAQYDVRLGRRVLDQYDATD